MSVTGQDWRVTAQSEVSRSVELVRRAESEPDAETADVLRYCWEAYQAAGAAVGSFVQGMVADGRPWSEVAQALGVPEAEVERTLQPLVAQGRERLAERLPHVAGEPEPAAEMEPAAEPAAVADPDVLPPPWVPLRPPPPLRDLQGELAERVAGLGARQVNLYRSLAHTPELLDAWIDWAWALRDRCATPRRLRELMILRTAVVMRSEYEWHQHRVMALDAGVPAEQVAALAAWQVSDLFDDREKAALTLTDAMLSGSVPDAVHDALAREFDDAERVELVLTAGCYAMVPRVLDALRVPVEGSAPTGSRRA